MNLSALRDAVRDRGGFRSTDAWATDSRVTAAINTALHKLETENPKGWDWLRYDGYFTTVAGTDKYPFAAITYGSTVTIMKIIELRVDTAPGQYVDSLPRVSKAALLGTYGSYASGVPESYAVDGQAVYFRPVPQNAFTIHYTAIIAEPDLVDPTDTPIMPVMFHDAIVEGATHMLFRSTQNTAGASMCQAAVTDWVRRMREYSNPYVGPGQVRDTLYSTRGQM